MQEAPDPKSPLASQVPAQQSPLLALGVNTFDLLIQLERGGRTPLTTACSHPPHMAGIVTRNLSSFLFALESAFLAECGACAC
ncbi:hypothetical protein O3P69_012336 [Scylla paramamosain]|uniref:Uncharacterized protein n=1 Tax=Scylla paramamosain TaxID=85552 RepID=A0AAW0SGG5_SCYPA